MPQVVVSREEPHWRLTLPPTETLPADEPSPPRKADKWNILDRCEQIDTIARRTEQCGFEVREVAGRKRLTACKTPSNRAPTFSPQDVYESVHLVET
jgi:hypothetical protein